MMMNRKKPASLHEAIRNLWKIRIMLEKNYTENCATWMAKRIESLIDHMQYGHALIAYHRQDGTFRLVRATLLPYKTCSDKTMTSQELQLPLHIGISNNKHGELSNLRISLNGAPYVDY